MSNDSVDNLKYLYDEAELRLDLMLTKIDRVMWIISNVGLIGFMIVKNRSKCEKIITTITLAKIIIAEANLNAPPNLLELLDEMFNFCYSILPIFLCFSFILSRENSTFMMKTIFKPMLGLNSRPESMYARNAYP
ncbi:unnamed protein product [Caenorhabditis bovis]|uniref:Uncharacterized protein n=1 Tax=Caenorhabditis bovis TaxID=2654633 RepID=A0A8S1E7F3_9PELO|nr:unnamed protein product [Caenorhabditis bovis]